MTTIDAPTRDLLQAVLAALDVPEPANLDRTDDRAYRQLMRQRMSDVSVCLTEALAHGRATAAATVIRTLTERAPITYAPYEPTDGGNA